MLRGFAGSGPSRGGFARSGPVFGIREAVAGRLDLATERAGEEAEEGAVGPADQVRGCPDGSARCRRQLVQRKDVMTPGAFLSGRPAGFVTVTGRMRP